MSFISKPLELTDRPLIESALKQNPLPLSDYTFTNLWMWNHKRSYKILQMDGFICLKFEQDSNEVHLYPMGEGSRNTVISKLGKHLTMRAIPENAGLNYSLTEEFGRADYIYLYEDLLELPGNRYQAKRNLIHQFTDTHDFEYKEITPDCIPQIKEMEQSWFEQHPEAELEHRAVMTLLNDFSHLNAVGGAIIVDSKVIAYSFAEYLTPDMLVVHVEKALTEYKGAYQIINQQLLMHLTPVRFVNREEDLGLPNLRKIKTSYHPIRLEKKYVLNLE